MAVESDVALWLIVEVVVGEMEVGDAIGVPHADNRTVQRAMHIEIVCFMLALPANETKELEL